MNTQKGFVGVHRSLQEHWLWDEKPFSKGQAWIDLIMLANIDLISSTFVNIDNFY